MNNNAQFRFLPIIICHILMQLAICDNVIESHENVNLLPKSNFCGLECQKIFLEKLDESDESKPMIVESNRIKRQATDISSDGRPVESPPSFVHPVCRNQHVRRICANVEYTAHVKSGLPPKPHPLPIEPNSIRAHDIQHRNITIQYYFVNGNPASYSNYFFIDAHTGSVLQLKPIPPDLTDRFVIIVLATKIGFRNLFSTARLTITVDQSRLRKNLHPPVLQITSLNGYIEENAKIGTIVRTGQELDSRPLQILVTDKDLEPGTPPATYQYVLTGIGAAVFAINQAGFIYLNVPDLNLYKARIYQLNIQARETETNPLLSSPVITVNISVLTLSSYDPLFSLSDHFVTALPDVNFQNILKVSAANKDKENMGDLVYRIVAVTNNGQNLFAYNSELSFLQAILPLEPKQRYQIVFEAVANGRKAARTNIHVEVLDQMTSSPETIATTQPANSEPPIFVTSEEYVQMSPKMLAEQNVSISEALPPNSVIMTFEKFHRRNIIYELVQGNEDGKFRIDSATGTLSSVVPLDREHKSSYHLLILLMKPEVNSTVLVNIQVIDANDNAPKFLNPSPIVFYVKEVPANYFVGQILTEDNDIGENGRVTLYFDPPNKHFAIGPQDGIIRTLLPLQHSNSDSYQLTVIASDNGRPPRKISAPVTLKILSDEPPPPVLPYFPINFYNISLKENSGSGEIVRVKALRNPPSTLPITYELRQGDPSLFYVDPSSGIVSTMNDLDAEQTQKHTIVIGVKENLQNVDNSTVTLLINVLDVNDWAPVFPTSNYFFTVADDFFVGTPIFKVTAQDNDLTAPNNIVHYKIANSNESGDLFKIDSETGLITVSKNLRDATRQDIMLLVEADDNGNPPLSSTATVTIRLQKSKTTPEISGITVPMLPENHNPVKFTIPFSSVSIMEGVEPDDFVQILPLENKHRRPSITCGIASGNYEDAFKIFVNNDGNCELRTNKILDRESVDRYVLNATVYSHAPSFAGDSSPADFTQITVAVLDANDNSPEFKYDDSSEDYKTYFAALDVNSKEFSSILTVKAVDKDGENNGAITYSIPTEDSDGRFFTITNNGEIKNVKVLSTITEKQSQFYQFRLVAKDSPSAGLPNTAFTDVKINGITNANKFAMLLEGIVPEQAYKYIPEIKKSLFNRTGPCRVVGVESVSESGVLGEDKPSTEIVWYAIDPTKGYACKRDQFSGLFDDESTKYIKGELDAYFKLQSLKPANSRAYGGSAALFGADRWQGAEIALIVLACLIAVGALIGIFSTCYFWSKYKASRVNFVPVDKMQFYGGLPKYNALLMPNSEKEYETQMAMCDDKDRCYTRSNADYSIDEGIYTVHQPPPRLNLFAQSRNHSKVYIPPPDYPVNPANVSSGAYDKPIFENQSCNGFKRDKTTIL